MGGSNNSYGGVSIDIGEPMFNLIFQNSAYHIIRRECEQCIKEYQTIFWVRLSNPESFGAYDYMRRWREDLSKF